MALPPRAASAHAPPPPASPPPASHIPQCFKDVLSTAVLLDDLPASELAHEIASMVGDPTYTTQAMQRVSTMTLRELYDVPVDEEEIGWIEECDGYRMNWD